MWRKIKESKPFNKFFVLSLVVTFMIPVVMQALVLTRTDSFRVFADNTDREYITAAVKKFEDGKYAYCLEHGKKAPDSGTDLQPGEVIHDPDVWKTLKYGYPNQTWYNTGDTTKDQKLNFYVTQVALWYFVHDWPMAKIDRFVQANSNDEYEAIVTDIPTLKKHVKSLIAQVEGDTSNIEPTLSFSETSLSLEGNSEAFTKSPLITVNGNNLTGNATIDLSGAPEGTYVENEGGQKTNNIAIGSKFRIVVPSNAGASTITYSTSGTGETLRAVNYPSDVKQDVVKYDEVKINLPTDTKGTLKWAPGVGKAQIQKVDADTGEPLENVVFEIKQGDQVKQTVTTNAQGLADLELKVGDYTVVEKSAPENYVVDPTPHPITIKNTGEVIPIAIKNTPVKSIVRVMKVDTETKEPLPNAEFALKQDGKVKYTAKSDESGKATFKDVLYGTYQLEEVKAPEGYLRDKATKEVVINRDTHGKTLTLEAPNQVIKGKIQIVKVDGENEEKPVKGAKFNLYKASDLNKEIATLTTDANGFAYTEDLRYGDYVLKEVDAPGDYYINDKLYPVSIRENGKVVVQYIVNKPVKFRLQILKVDGETKQPLEGAHFQIHQDGKPVEFTYQVGNKVVKETTFVSDKEGLILLPKELQGGKYQLVEVKAPVGYKPIDPIDFEISRDTQLDEDELGKIFKIEVTNDIIKGNVELIKVDAKDHNKKLEGVKFELYKTTKVPDTAGKDETTKDENTENKEDNVVEKMVKGIKNLFTREGEEQQDTQKPQEGEEQQDTQKPQEDTEEQDTQKPQDGEEEQDTNKPSDNLLTEEQKPLENGDQLIGVYQTDANGSIRVNDLKFGSYYFKEVETIEGYVLADKPIEFQITEDGKKIDLTAENDKITGKVEITKEDVSTGEALPDTGIRIYMEDKETVVYEGRTDENGKLEFGPLEYGKYYFQEFDAPEGYVIDETLFPFEIKENDEIVKCKMTNKKIQGELEITKVDLSTGELLPDTRFAVYGEDGKEVVAKGTTDKNGIARFKLDYGKYYYQEIEAPKGYMIDNKKYPFEIKSDGEIVKCRMTNTKLPKTGALPINQIAMGAPVAIVGLTGLYALLRKRD